MGRLRNIIASAIGKPGPAGKPDVTGESRLGSQTVSISYSGQLANPLPASFATYRTMRKHPTIALARALTAAPVVAGEWSIEADDGVSDDRIDLIKDIFLPVRSQIVETALLGGTDFGWAGFEKIFSVVKGRVRVRFKPLLHDITGLLVVRDTGAFAGYEQTRDQTTLPLANSLHIGFRVEGTEWHGASLLENVRSPYNDWVKASEGAARYDKKIAGSHWVVHYPDGQSKVDDVETANAEIAKTMLGVLESSGGAVIPRPKLADLRSLAQAGVDLDVAGWGIELVSDSSARQHSFTNRLEYLDKLMVRGLMVPERAILEGQFGTKAEAGVHADLALTHMELLHEHITRHINWYAVDQVLDLNFGPDARGTVRLAPSPLVDAKREWMQGLFEKFIDNPSSMAAEYAAIDTDAMKETLGVPVVAPTDKEIALPVPGTETEGAGAALVRDAFREAGG